MDARGLSGDAPLGPGQITRLRLAGALVHALPGAWLRLRGSLGTGGPGGVLLDVGRRPGGTGSARGLVSPCEFRRAVACAHRRDRAGRTMALRGLAPDGVLHLELGLPLPGRVLPGPIVRRPGTRGTLDVFTTPLPPAAARAAMHDEAREVLSASGGEVGYHLDAALDVTLVHVAVPHREGADVLRLLEACAVAELDRELVAAGLGALTPEEPRSDPGR